MKQRDREKAKEGRKKEDICAGERDMGEDLAIPIDVVFSKLSDWLVDRKRIPSDWRKRLLTVRSKIASAFANLPKDLNPWFATLTIEGKVSL